MREPNPDDLREGLHYVEEIIRESEGLGAPEVTARWAAVATAVRNALALEEWTPTSANINALPSPIRDFIHDLETRADPAHNRQAAVVACDTIRALEARIAELEAAVDAIERAAAEQEQKQQSE